MREYLTVTELNKHIDHLMQTDVILSDLWLKGEISGFKHHRQSGHCYFTLKDRNSSVSSEARPGAPALLRKTAWRS